MIPTWLLEFAFQYWTVGTPQASLFYDQVSRRVLNVIKNNGNPIPTSFFSFECYIGLLEIFAKICIYTIKQHDDVALREWDRNDKKASKIKK